MKPGRFPHPDALTWALSQPYRATAPEIWRVELCGARGAVYHGVGVEDIRRTDPIGAYRYVDGDVTAALHAAYRKALQSLLAHECAGRGGGPSARRGRQKPNPGARSGRAGGGGGGGGA